MRKLGDLAEISAMAISKYERNESMPSSGVRLALAKALGVRVEYIKESPFDFYRSGSLF